MPPPGTTAVVLGGSGGIGAAAAGGLADAGYDIVLVARDRRRLTGVAATIPGARIVVADAATEATMARAMAALGRIGVLVHAAGARIGRAVAEQPAELLDSLYRSHLRAAFVSVRAALAHMVEGGRIVLISSVAAHRPVPGLAGYCAMKAALGMFAESLRHELAGRIGVSVVVPAQVDTPMLAKRWRCIQPEDVAAAVVYLAGLDAALHVDELELRATLHGPFAPPLSGPPDAPVGVVAVPR